MLLKMFGKDERGFTLIELMTVIAIMAVLAAVSVPVYKTFITKAQEAQVLTAADPVRQALALINADENAFPKDSTSSADLYTAIQDYVSLDAGASGKPDTIKNTRVQLASAADDGSGDTTNVTWTTGGDTKTVKGFIEYVGASDGGNYTLRLFKPADDPATATPFQCFDASGEDSATADCSANTPPTP